LSSRSSATENGQILISKFQFQNVVILIRRSPQTKTKKDLNIWVVF